MKKLDEQRKIELKMFLTELGKITQRYKFVIGGFDCYGGPYIKDLTSNEYYDYFTYDNIINEYKVTGDFL